MPSYLFRRRQGAVRTEEIVLPHLLCRGAPAASPVLHTCSSELSSHLANRDYLFGAKHISEHTPHARDRRNTEDLVLREPGHLRIVRSTSPRKVTVMTTNSRSLASEYQRLAIRGV